MKKLSKEELLKRVGDISQIARITDFRFESGKAEGMRGLEEDYPDMKHPWYTWEGKIIDKG